MQSKAKTVQEYLGGLPPDRRAAIEAVRKVILKHLPKGFEETMQYGMIGYVVPLRIYPPGYHCGKDIPLPFASLASQKNHMAIYLCNVFGHKETDAWFRREYKASGKKLDMGGSCVRFKQIEDLPLDLIGKVIARTPVKHFIKLYESAIKKPRG